MTLSADLFKMVDLIVSEEEGKDLESIYSSTTPDTGLTKAQTPHTIEPRDSEGFVYMFNLFCL